MPLKQNADPVDLAALLTSFGSDPASGFSIHAGNTTRPNNAITPAYEIDVVPAGAQFTASVVMQQRAAEGTNDSFYLRAGVFETNRTLDVGMLEADRKSGNVARMASYLGRFENRSANRVYFSMPDDMAERNRRAEVEHCNDLIHAYRQTLGALDAALTTIAPVNAPTQGEAGERIAAAIRNALPRDRVHLGINPAVWRQEYERLCDRTRFRDDQGWHSFGLELVDAQDVRGRDDPSYLTGGRRDDAGFPIRYLRFTTGTTQIGVHPSDQVVV
jgi:hypothetical protein